MSAFERDFTRWLRPILRDSFDREGEAIVGSIVQLISVPVEKIGPGRVVRSKPGEPPRRESGELSRGIMHNVVASKGLVQLVVSAERAPIRAESYYPPSQEDASVHLEQGGRTSWNTQLKPRPYMVRTVSKHFYEMRLL